MKRKIISIIILLITIVATKAQSKLEVVYLNKDISTHFLSKVIIDKIDISTKFVVGQLQNKKIVAIKPVDGKNSELGVLSIIGEDYFKQYRLKYTNNIDRASSRINIDNNTEDFFVNPNYKMTFRQMWEYCHQIEKESPNYNNVSSKANSLIIKLNNIYVKNDYIFVDYTIRNKTNLMYDVNDIKYIVEDKKVTKNTNIQRLLIDANYEYNREKTFKKQFRNILCFDKMTFPNNKIFIIELSEKQISGRTVRLSLNYSDILNADSL